MGWVAATKAAPERGGWTVHGRVADWFTCWWQGSDDLPGMLVTDAELLVAALIPRLEERPAPRGTGLWW